MIYLEYLLFRLFFFSNSGNSHLRLRAVWELWRLMRQGRLDIVHTYTSKAGLLAMPSLNEGRGTALVEAMYARLPCVATRVGGVPELLADDVGLLVDASSPRELGGALRPIGGRL